jgi:hypothetical protein
MWVVAKIKIILQTKDIYHRYTKKHKYFFKSFKCEDRKAGVSGNSFIKEISYRVPINSIQWFYRSSLARLC